jgi:hypothetical protein
MDITDIRPREKGDSAFGTPGNQSLAKKPGFLEK